MRFEDVDPERRVELISELESHVKQGASLTSGLLLFSRRDVPRKEVFDLNASVQKNYSLLRRLIREDIHFVIDQSDDILLIEADQSQLSQVLTNLVVNACDSMPDGGRLTIRTGRDGPDTVWIDVEDTGKGIPEEIRARIFEPFFTTKERERGTGLGLSVVHGIVTHHGGRIEVESREGQGARFRVSLPSAASGIESAPAEAEPAGELPRGQGERILLVEDDEAIRSSLKQILIQLGYEVVSAGSAEEAVDLAADQSFDVLLTDLVLPGERGDALALSLRRKCPDLTVVIMSGYAFDETMQMALQVETATFLHKPFEIERLAEVMRVALNPEVSASRVVVTEAPVHAVDGPATVLVVEDARDIRRTMVLFLETCGYIVYSAADGGEALGLLTEKGGQIDLVISDVQLPVLDGVALLEKSRALGLDLPFLFCSGDPLCEVDGAGVDFLQKPFELQELSLAIEGLLRSGT